MTPLPSTGQITTVSSLANGITLDRASCPSGNVAKLQYILEVDVDLVTVPEIEAWQYLLQDFIWKARPSRRFPNVQRNNQQ